MTIAAHVENTGESTLRGVALSDGRRLRYAAHWMPIIATAENYSIALEDMRAVVKVWKRPDIDAATGAQRAAELVAHVRALTVDRARSVLMDLNAAPPVAGPKTSEVLADLLRTCERAGVPVAFVYGADAVQALQCRRLVAEHAPKHGRAVRDLAEAEAFLGTRGPLSRT